MLSHTGDLGSRLDTLDDIDTEKTAHIPKLLHCSQIHITRKEPYYELLVLKLNKN